MQDLTLFSIFPRWHRLPRLTAMSNKGAKREVGSSPILEVHQWGQFAGPLDGMGSVGQTDAEIQPCLAAADPAENPVFNLPGFLAAGVDLKEEIPPVRLAEMVKIGFQAADGPILAPGKDGPGADDLYDIILGDMDQVRVGKAQ